MAPNPIPPNVVPDQNRAPLVQPSRLWERVWFDWFLAIWKAVKASTVAGLNGSVQYNDNGVQAGDKNLLWDKTKQTVTAESVIGGTEAAVRATTVSNGEVDLNPVSTDDNQILLGMRQTGGNAVAVSTSAAYLFQFSGGGADLAGYEVNTGLTPGAPNPFSNGVGVQITGAGAATDPATVEGYAYGLGTGAVAGVAIVAQRNTDGAGAAGLLGGQLKDGRFFVIWMDATGAMRYNVGATLASIRPTESGSVSDTSGHLFGSGSGGGTITNIFSRRPDEGRSGIPGTQGPQGAAGATGATGPQGPAGSQVPIVVTTNTTLATQTCWVVSESLEIAAGIILEIAGGARVEITGAAGYPPPAFVKISEVVPSAATGTVTFASIPQTFTHLKILYTGRSNIAAFSDTLNIRVNGDTAANYDIERIQAFATTLTAAETIGGTSGQLAQISGASAPSGLSGSGEITCENYTNQAFNKIGTSLTAYKQDVTSGNTRMNHYGWSWRNSAAITQIDLILGSGNFVAGSKFSLYGIT